MTSYEDYFDSTIYDEDAYRVMLGERPQVYKGLDEFIEKRYSVGVKKQKDLKHIKYEVKLYL